MRRHSDRILHSDGGLSRPHITAKGNVKKSIDKIDAEGIDFKNIAENYIGKHTPVIIKDAVETSVNAEGKRQATNINIEWLQGKATHDEFAMTLGIPMKDMMHATEKLRIFGDADTGVDIMPSGAWGGKQTSKVYRKKSMAKFIHFGRKN